MDMDIYMHIHAYNSIFNHMDMVLENQLNPGKPKQMRESLKRIEGMCLCQLSPILFNSNFGAQNILWRFMFKIDQTALRGVLTGGYTTGYQVRGGRGRGKKRHLPSLQGKNPAQRAGYPFEGLQKGALKSCFQVLNFFQQIDKSLLLRRRHLGGPGDHLAPLPLEHAPSPQHKFPGTQRRGRKKIDSRGILLGLEGGGVEPPYSPHKNQRSPNTLPPPRSPPGSSP